ncbi:MAG: ribosome biogenesis factor YjgA [Tatlockia sp.]|jgi:ribosome-associated protein
MEDIKSKSQKKREADALQKLGTKLVALSKEKLNALPLPTTLYQAIIEAKSIKSHGAIRRQSQLIGKLMRASDYEAILAAYEEMTADDGAQTAVFHELEQWRDKLIHEGKEALTAFIETYHPNDIQQLRQLVKKAIDEQASNKPMGAAKALFRFLRSCI